MKKILIRKKMVAFVGLLGIVLLPISASAFELTGSEEFTLGENESVTEDLYVGAGNATVAGNVFGDLLVGGGKLFLSGTTTEDVNVAGGNITFSGTALDDLRVAGGDIVISGTASSSLVVLGGSVHVTPEAEVGGDALVAAGEARIGGEVADELEIYAGRVYLNGTIGGDVTIHAETIEIGPNAEVLGDLTYYSSSEATIASDAEIGGEITFERVEAPNAGFNFTGVLLTFLMLLAGALLFGLGFKRFSNRIYSRGMTQSAWKYFLLGLAFVVFTPFVILMLLITLIGSPLGLLLLLVYIAMLIVAWFYGAILLGSFLWQWMKKEGKTEVTWQGIVFGVFLFVVLSFVPIVGWIIQTVFIVVALGSLIFVKYEEVKRLR